MGCGRLSCRQRDCTGETGRLYQVISGYLGRMPMGLRAVARRNVQVTQAWYLGRTPVCERAVARGIVQVKQAR